MRFPGTWGRRRCAAFSPRFFAAMLFAFCFFSCRLFAQEEPVFRALHSENGARLTSQNRVNHEPPNQHHFERLAFDLPPESSIVLGHFLGGFPLVIDDLSPTVRVRAAQQGIVLGAQVVLPYAVHPQSGEPFTFLVAGNRYSGSGNWETLGFYDKTDQSNLAKRVEQIAKRLRATLGQHLDIREMYVRQIFLYVEPVFDGRTGTVLDIDKPQITGYVTTKNEWVERYELMRTASNHVLYRTLFDPVNFSAFRMQNSLLGLYGTYRTANDGGHTVWVSSMDSPTPTPLKATPFSVAHPRYRQTTTPPSMVYGPHFPIVASDHHDNSSAVTPDNQTRVLTNPNHRKVDYQLLTVQEPLRSVATPASQMSLRLSDGTFYINDIPKGIRAIEYRGEPLSELYRLKFNAVWVDGPPSHAILEEARRVGIWLICTPPGRAELEQSRRNQSDPVPVKTYSPMLDNIPVTDPIYDYVLAWNIGNSCAASELQPHAELAARLKNADRYRNRPIICTANSDLRGFSRIVDILMIRSEPILSSLDLFEHLSWQNDYRNQALPEKPFWQTIQTQPSPRVMNQWTLFGANPQEICAVSYEQIKMQVHQAVGSGIHGLLFTSQTPLTNNDPETEYRRLALELINWELQLIDEWFASGTSDGGLVTSDKRQISSAVLKTHGTRLMIPIWQQRDSQLAVSPAFVDTVRYVVPGVPETFDAFHLTPGRLTPLVSTRVAGGMELILDEATLNSIIVFGEEAAIYAKVGKTAEIIGPIAADLACRLAELQLKFTEAVVNSLKTAQDTKTMPRHKDQLPLMSVLEQGLFAQTRDFIARARNLAKSSPPSYHESYLLAEKATRGLRHTSRELLREATRNESNLCMTPVSVSFATLPYHLNFYQRASQGCREGSNRLPAGDMENLQQWCSAGWIGTVRSKSNGTPFLELSSAAKRTGNTGLRIALSPSDPAKPPTLLETTPFGVTSPPMRVRAGELLCISGWIKIPKSLTSTVDGLMIYDSIGGEPLALRFKDNTDWREFAMYRYAPQDCNFYFVFGMSGFGEVFLDDVRMTPIEFVAPQPQQPSASPQSNQPWQWLNPLQYIPSLPGRR